MYHLVDNFQDKAGNALVGYYVKLKVPGGAYATLYADENLTPIVSVSGVADTAVTDANGMYDIYVEDGEYETEFFDKSDINQRIQTVPATPLYSGTFTASGTGAVAETLQTVLRRSVWAEGYGLVGTTMAAFDALSSGAKAALASANSAALLAAITALRGNSVTLSTDGLGSGSLTAYSTGELLLGEGVFPFAPDTLALTQDLGLVIKGRGSRRTNNSVRGRTNLLAYGTSSGFGIQAKGNGARGLTLLDVDVTYYDSNFTGDLVDVYSAPGVVIDRCYLGTNGITAGTRLTTARSCLRSTYDEFLTVRDSAFNGAVDGWWSDDTREPSAAFSDFGGSLTFFANLVVYDVTGKAFRHDGNRTRSTLTLQTIAYNPIAVDGQYGAYLVNVDGLSLVGSQFAGSVANKAVVEWVRATNCTGVIEGCAFNDLSKAGTLGGYLTVTGNTVYCTDGFTFVSGVLTGGANEFSQGTSGWTFAPTGDCAFRVGPDLFKPGVTYSYDVPADNAFLAGRICYDRQSDASTSGFRQTSSRVTIEGLDEKLYTESGNVTLSIRDVGRTVAATGTGGQTLSLPSLTGSNNIELTIVKMQTTGSLTINGPSSGTLLTGNGAAKTSLTGAAADYGGTVTVRSTPFGWVVVSKVGTWTEA